MLQATSREGPGDQKAKQRPTGSQAGFTCLRMNQPRTTIFGQAHTIKDVLHILEPAFGAGLPRPTDEQLARKCLGYYIAACVSQGDVALLSVAGFIHHDWQHVFLPEEFHDLCKVMCSLLCQCHRWCSEAVLRNQDNQR